jgi:integral membrane protein (TIGR00529 family)
MAVLKLLFILALIIFGIKKKVFVGYLLGVAGAILPLLFGVAPIEVVKGFGHTLSDLEFWKLFAAIVIVTVLGHLLKRIGALDRLTVAAQELAGGKRTATVVLPAAIGMMPMPGGALLSAPLVAEVLKEDQKSPVFLAAANYWFRHIMEFFWPLYPGIILAAGIVGISVQRYSFLGVIMTVAMVLIGYFFFLRRIDNNGPTNRHSLRAIGQLLLALWPLLLAVFLALATGLDIVIALLIAITITIILNRSSWRQFWPTVKEAVNLRLFFMVFGILVFKDMVALSGAVGNIPAEVARFGIPPVAIIFVVTFLCGLLSGMTAAFIGLSYPILSGFLYTPEINLNNIFIAHLSGYLGMILSPTHFCLLLTAEHFKADLMKVYRRFLPPLVILAAVGFALYFLGYPWNLIHP